MEPLFILASTITAIPCWRSRSAGPMPECIRIVGLWTVPADNTPTSARATATNRITRLLGVLDEWLAGRDWVMGADYSIADISLLGWVEAVPERTPGFAIQALACTMLWIGALGGALWRLVH